MKLYKYLFFLLLFSSNSLLYAQANYSQYLKDAKEELQKGDCEKAEKLYQAYRSMANKRNIELEQEINLCKGDNTFFLNNDWKEQNLKGKVKKISQSIKNKERDISSFIEARDYFEIKYGDFAFLSYKLFAELPARSMLFDRQGYLIERRIGEVLQQYRYIDDKLISETLIEFESQKEQNNMGVLMITWDYMYNAQGEVNKVEARVAGDHNMSGTHIVSKNLSKGISTITWTGLRESSETMTTQIWYNEKGKISKREISYDDKQFQWNYGYVNGELTSITINYKKTNDNEWNSAGQCHFFDYEYDSQRNWVKRSEKGKGVKEGLEYVFITTREFEYY